MSVTIYGASDDLVEVEGDVREEFSALGNENFDGDGGYLAFSDGTILSIVYGDRGVWRIVPIAEGSGELSVKQAPVGDEDDYSDIATLSGDLEWVVFGSAYAKR